MLSSIASVLAATAGLQSGILFLFLPFIVPALSTDGYDVLFEHPCDDNIYCHGEMLHRIQLSTTFNDSKTFVDMPMKFSRDQIWKNFNLLLNTTGGNPSNESLAKFVEDNFEQTGMEFEEWEPTDWIANPGFLDGIKDAKLRVFADDLHKRWFLLGRKMKAEVQHNQDKHSLIYVPHPMIIPGGRFREMYYWDSFWVLRGLLISNMTHTTRGMLENFFHLVRNISLIPNGARVYYERRSQPPFLIPMVADFVNATGDQEFLRKNILILDKEYDFWLKNRTFHVEHNGKSYRLAKYFSAVGGPRPESYKEDLNSALELPEDKRQNFLRLMKAGAESGLDYSTRWFRVDGQVNGTLKDISMHDIIPVELNALLCGNAHLLAGFHKQLGNEEKATQYSTLGEQFREAIQSVLYDESEGSWFDYTISTKTLNKNFYPSNLSPLFTKCYLPADKEKLTDKAVDYLERSNALSFKGGIPSSLNNSGQQWDYPNGWPPHNHMIMLALENGGTSRSLALALELARKWVNTNFLAFKQSVPSAMFEKYDVTSVGLPGGGGEYDIQLGFGWTNGVILELLHKYGDVLVAPPEEKLSTEAADDHLHKANVTIAGSGSARSRTTDLLLLCLSFCVSSLVVGKLWS